MQAGLSTKKTETGLGHSAFLLRSERAEAGSCTRPLPEHDAARLQQERRSAAIMQRVAALIGTSWQRLAVDLAVGDHVT